MFYIVIFLGLIIGGIFVVAKINQSDTGAMLFVYNKTNSPSPGPVISLSPAPVTLPINPSPFLATTSPTFTTSPTVRAKTTPVPKPAKISRIILPVPYISEAPSGNFSDPWRNACEEASIAMVENYYLGKKSVGIKEAENFMRVLFDAQDALYGSNAHSDAARTAELINTYSSYNAVVKTDPKIEEIKNELRQKRPVISVHRGFDLKNKNIPFRPTASSYHVVVIIGYDDKTRQFITHDSGDRKRGAGRRYGYDLFMASLHDYDYLRDKADGPARVIFTSPRQTI